MINKQILQGRIVRYPDVRKTKKDKLVCEFTLAWSYNKNSKRFLFQDCVAFDKIAKTISQYCKKGQEILVCGQPFTNEWTDKNGSKNRRNKLEVLEIHFCGYKDQIERDENEYETEIVSDEEIENLPW